jgi:hypothetical protein
MLIFANAGPQTPIVKQQPQFSTQPNLFGQPQAGGGMDMSQLITTLLAMPGGEQMLQQFGLSPQQISDLKLQSAQQILFSKAQSLGLSGAALGALGGSGKALSVSDFLPPTNISGGGFAQPSAFGANMGGNVLNGLNNNDLNNITNTSGAVALALQQVRTSVPGFNTELMLMTNKDAAAQAIMGNSSIAGIQNILGGIGAVGASLFDGGLRA